MRITNLVLLGTCIAAAALAGCSSQQLYGAGQEWQRNECNRINDTQERQRCMASTRKSYDDYKRESDAAKGGK